MFQVDASREEAMFGNSKRNRVEKEKKEEERRSIVHASIFVSKYKIKIEKNKI